MTHPLQWAIDAKIQTRTVTKPSGEVIRYIRYGKGPWVEVFGGASRDEVSNQEPQE